MFVTHVFYCFYFTQGEMQSERVMQSRVSVDKEITMLVILAVNKERTTIEEQEILLVILRYNAYMTRIAGWGTI